MIIHRGCGLVLSDKTNDDLPYKSYHTEEYVL